MLVGQAKPCKFFRTVKVPTILSSLPVAAVKRFRVWMSGCRFLVFAKTKAFISSRKSCYSCYLNNLALNLINISRNINICGEGPFNIVSDGKMLEKH